MKKKLQIQYFIWLVNKKKIEYIQQLNTLGTFIKIIIIIKKHLDILKYK